MMDDCTNVVVETTLGARYEFPDMPRAMIELVIQKSGWAEHGNLIMVNVSGAVINIPARTVKTISFDGKVQAHGPGSAVHELPTTG